MLSYINTITQFLRKLLPKSVLKHIPEPVLLLYHRLVNAVAVIQYGKPSRKLTVVGVTGTNGKTSTTLLIRNILQSASVKTGLLSTAEISIGDETVPNDKHATMIGRGFIHMQLKKMADIGCKVAVVETTSEGIKQYRHKGVEYDILVFTNLTPEHLQSHGGNFEKYKKAKMTVFKNLHKRFRKENVPKVILANADDKHGADFLQCKADKNISFGIDSGDVRAENMKIQDGITFSLASKDGKETYHVPLPGKFNVYNALAAILVSKELGLEYPGIAKGLKNTRNLPGRMEAVNEGQNFRIFIDFAHEGVGIQNAFNALQELRKEHKIIALVGGVGGGRDRRNRFEIGRAAAKLTNITVVTTEDPYDDDPAEIVADIVSTAKEGGLVEGETLFTEIDRRNGIRKALSLAEKDDIVIITGKGAELTMMVKGKAIPWDERAIVREEVRNIMKAQG